MILKSLLWLIRLVASPTELAWALNYSELYEVNVRLFAGTLTHSKFSHLEAGTITHFQTSDILVENLKSRL